MIRLNVMYELTVRLSDGELWTTVLIGWRVVDFTRYHPNVPYWYEVAF